MRLADNAGHSMLPLCGGSPQEVRKEPSPARLPAGRASRPPGAPAPPAIWGSAGSRPDRRRKAGILGWARDPVLLVSRPSALSPGDSGSRKGPRYWGGSGGWGALISFRSGGHSLSSLANQTLGGPEAARGLAGVRRRGPGCPAPPSAFPASAAPTPAQAALSRRGREAVAAPQSCLCAPRPPQDPLTSASVTSPAGPATDCCAPWRPNAVRARMRAPPSRALFP